MVTAPRLEASKRFDAAVPMVKKPAPSYFRFMLGAFEITVFLDGTIPCAMDQLLTNTTPKRVHELLAASFEKDPYEMSFHCYLVNTGARLILIDAGGAILGGPNLGNLAPLLKLSGYRPEQIEEIYMTHLHDDHIGGLTHQEQAAFPHAVLRVSKVDADFWLNEKNMADTRPELQAYFPTAMAAVKPYSDAGRFRTFDADQELSPGVRSQALYGHSPGHSGFVIESEGQTLEIWGDVLHSIEVQMTDPQTTFLFDYDPEMAMRRRREKLEDAVTKGYLIASTHVTFPGLGHLLHAPDGYRWLPASYTVIR